MQYTTEDLKKYEEYLEQQLRSRSFSVEETMRPFVEYTSPNGGNPVRIPIFTYALGTRNIHTLRELYDFVMFYLKHLGREFGFSHLLVRSWPHFDLQDDVIVLSARLGRIPSPLKENTIFKPEGGTFNIIDAAMLAA